MAEPNFDDISLLTDGNETTAEYDTDRPLHTVPVVGHPEVSESLVIVHVVYLLNSESNNYRSVYHILMFNSACKG